MISLSIYKKGLILSGISAGMICWFDEGTTDSFGGLDPLKCLGFLKGSASPNFDGEKDRRPKYIKFIKQGTIKGGLALDDGVGAEKSRFSWGRRASELNS